MKALYSNSSTERKAEQDAWTEPRIFDRLYTVPVVLPGGANYTASTPIFFNIQTVFKGITVRCISIASTFFPLWGAGETFFLTLKNTRGEELLYNHPVVNLWNGFNPGGGGSYEPGYGKQLRLFNLPNIDLRQSYYWSNFSTPAGPPVEAFRITFYW